MTQYNDLIGELQNKAEDEFGQQKRGVKIRCGDFDNNGPYIFYNENNLDDITIYISTNCINNQDLAKFQIAHEIIHCLHPNHTQDVTNLEEGVAVLFQKRCMPMIDFGPNDGKYVNVYNLANNLLKYDEQIIKKAREYEPNISKIPIPLLLNICPQINHNLLNALVRPFYR